MIRRIGDRVVESLWQGGGLDAENEDIKLIEISTGAAFGQLERGEIQDAKTIVGLMWLRTRLGSAGGQR